jgi:hypothetical protein
MTVGVHALWPVGLSFASGEIMDFEEAIAAHAGWKTRLQDYLKKPYRSLKAAEVEGNNKHSWSMDA